MLDRFNEHIDSRLPFLRGKRSLVACSGGVDSMVLAHLAEASGLDMALAHCNFQLRGAESDGDEQFVRSWAGERGIRLFSKRFDTRAHADGNRQSIQMAARELRYAWFEELLDGNGLDFVLTAHQGDDNLETFLINLSRGTGIEGLLGIPTVNGRVVRPLLEFSREELLAHAQQEGISWREDSSNEDLKYLRNQIRHTVVPSLRALHPSFFQNVRRTQSNLQQAHGLMDNHLKETRERLFVPQGDGQRINLSALGALHPLRAYLYGLFHPYGFKDAGELERLMGSMSGKVLLSPTHSLVRDRKELILTRPMGDLGERYVIPEGKIPEKLPISLSMEGVDALGEAGRDHIYLDKEKLNFPLLLRKWEKGDYFYPFGMKGKKKLAKYFKDEKVDLPAKQRQWLLCSGKDLVWVVGRRMDRRFAVEGSTKEIIRITVKP